MTLPSPLAIVEGFANLAGSVASVPTRSVRP
jgi:hypothetical protein